MTDLTFNKFEYSEQKMIDDQYSINYHYMLDQYGDEVCLFVSMNLAHKERSDFIKNVGWFQLTYADSVTVPHLSLAIELIMPHPKSDQKLVKAALQAIPLVYSTIEVLQDLELPHIVNELQNSAKKN